MKVLSILLLMTVVLAQDCRTKNNSDTDSTEVKPLMKIRKNPCFGQCPTYSMTIHNDGSVIYAGKDNTVKMGTFTKQIPTEQVATLRKIFDDINFMEMEKKYVGQLRDLPKTNITLFYKDTSKTVTGDYARPESLKALDAQLVAIADSKEGWTLTEKHAHAKELPAYFIKNEIITKFKPNIDIKQYIKDQEKYGMEIKKRVAPKLDLWVITYDTTMMDPSLMLDHMKKSVEIEVAEFNKQITPREH